MMKVGVRVGSDHFTSPSPSPYAEEAALADGVGGVAELGAGIDVRG
jgi:hypothetical protein